MPLGDRTGPQGLGPRTGRGLGYCSGSPVPGYMNNWGGRGGGFGRGGGRGAGLGRGYGKGIGWGYGAAYAPLAYASPVYNPDPQAQASALRAQADELKIALENITRELENLEKSDSNQ